MLQGFAGNLTLVIVFILISFILDCYILTNDTSMFDQILKSKNYFDR